MPPAELHGLNERESDRRDPALNSSHDYAE